MVSGGNNQRTKIGEEKPVERELGYINYFMQMCNPPLQPIKVDQAPNPTQLYYAYEKVLEPKPERYPAKLFFLLH